MRLFKKTPKTTTVEDVIAQARALGAKIDAELEAQRQDTLEACRVLGAKMTAEMAARPYWD
jgi:hypothetical protein